VRSPSAVAFFSHTVRGGDTRWLLEVFSPLFDCDDVTEDCGGGMVARHSGVEGASAAPPTTAQRETIVLRLRPKTGGVAEEGECGVDEDEAAAVAEYAAARRRLGLR